MADLKIEVSIGPFPKNFKSTKIDGGETATLPPFDGEVDGGNAESPPAIDGGGA